MQTNPWSVSSTEGTSGKSGRQAADIKVRFSRSRHFVLRDDGMGSRNQGMVKSPICLPQGPEGAFSLGSEEKQTLQLLWS